MSEPTTFTAAQHALLSARLRRPGCDASPSSPATTGHAALPALGVIFFSGVASGPGPYDLLLDVARYVDKAGFHAIWTPERHFTEVGGAYPNPALLAAALATVTHRVRLRAGSINLPLHDPLRVAEEWAVVDQLSNGRVDLAVAPGWHLRDFALKPENFKGRFDILNDYREQVRQAWRGEPIERKDAFGDAHSIVTWPRPVQTELPIWLTTSQREEAWEFAGRSGFNVLTALINFGPNDLERRIAIYRTAREAAGWNPTQGTVSLMLHTYVNTDASLAVERVRPALTQYLKSFVSQHQSANQAESNDKVRTLQSLGDDQDDFVEMVFSRYVTTSSLIGDVAETQARLTAFRRMGVDEVACLIDFGLDKTCVLNSLRLLSRLIEPRQT